jgi:hypothetical protein
MEAVARKPPAKPKPGVFDGSNVLCFVDMSADGSGDWRLISRQGRVIVSENERGVSIVLVGLISFEDNTQDPFAWSFRTKKKIGVRWILPTSVTSDRTITREARVRVTSITEIYPDADLASFKVVMRSY